MPHTPQSDRDLKFPVWQMCSPRIDHRVLSCSLRVMLALFTKCNCLWWRRRIYKLRSTLLTPGNLVPEIWKFWWGWGGWCGWDNFWCFLCYKMWANWRIKLAVGKCEWFVFLREIFVVVLSGKRHESSSEYETIHSIFLDSEIHLIPIFFPLPNSCSYFDGVGW